VTRVLVTAGEHIGPLGALRALHAGGYEPWGAAHGPGSYAERSRLVAGTVVVPRGDGFAEAVRDAAVRHGVAAVLPGVERDLVALSEARASFPAEVAVGAPPPETVARATDKQALAEVCARVGIETPPTSEIAAGEDVELPAVVKPLRSELRDEGGRLVHAAPAVVSTREALHETLAAYPGGRGLVQPFLSDRIYGLCGVAWNGELVCSEHQVSERIWPVDAGMVSYVETVERDRDLDARIARFVAEIGWSGIFQLQLLEHDGRLYAIDLNPRIYISVSLAVTAGMNLPAIWADLLLGREPRVSDYRVGVRWRNDEDDPRAIASHLLHGDRRRGARGLHPRRRTTHAVFSWRDPGPSLRSVAKLVSRARASRGRG
jgi:predicted ATP-grasp superfamily ATP-dependent carboligase